MNYHVILLDKILTLMDHIDKNLAENEGARMNKRAIYYTLVDEKVQSTGELDTYIA